MKINRCNIKLLKRKRFISILNCDWIFNQHAPNLLPRLSPPHESSSRRQFYTSLSPPIKRNTSVPVTKRQSPSRSPNINLNILRYDPMMQRFEPLDSVAGKTVFAAHPPRHVRGVHSYLSLSPSFSISFICTSRRPYDQRVTRSLPVIRTLERRMTRSDGGIRSSQASAFPSVAVSYIAWRLTDRGREFLQDDALPTALRQLTGDDSSARIRFQRR